MELTIDKIGVGVGGLGAVVFLLRLLSDADRGNEAQVTAQIWAGVVVLLFGVGVAVYGMTRERR